MTPELQKLVDDLGDDLATFQRDHFDVWYRLLPHINADTIDAIFERMTPLMRDRFTTRARTQLAAYHELIASAASEGYDAETYRVLRRWTARRPFPVIAPRPFDEISQDFGCPPRTFVELFLYFETASVEEVVAKLRPNWRHWLLDIAPSLEAELPAFIATARQSGHDPTGFEKIIRWAAQQPDARSTAETTRRAHEGL